MRIFEFDAGVPLWDALRTIRAALEDEGLTLSDSNTTGDKPYSVKVGKVKRVYVPATRILPRLHAL